MPQSDGLAVWRLWNCQENCCASNRDVVEGVYCISEETNEHEEKDAPSLKEDAPIDAAKTVAQGATAAQARDASAPDRPLAATQAGDAAAVVEPAGQESPLAEIKPASAPEPAPEPTPATATRVGTEEGICPVSGLPLEKPKLRMSLDMEWAGSGTKLTVSVRPHFGEYFGRLGLTDAATSEEVKAGYQERVRQLQADKQPKDATSAEEHLEKVQEAYEALKDISGQLTFPWEAHSKAQTVASGDDAVRLFEKYALEACEADRMKGAALRRLAASSKEVRALVFQEGPGGEGSGAEARVSALCVNFAGGGCDHLVRIHRRLTGA